MIIKGNDVKFGEYVILAKENKIGKLESIYDNKVNVRFDDNSLISCDVNELELPNFKSIKPKNGKKPVSEKDIMLEQAIRLKSRLAKYGIIIDIRQSAAQNVDDSTLSTINKLLKKDEDNIIEDKASKNEVSETNAAS